MIVEIRMPEVAADMTEADVVGWLAAPGDEITQGDILFEIETDKSTVEVEAPATGILKEIHVAAGETGVAVGALLAVMESDEEAQDAQKAEDTPSDPAPEPQAAEQAAEAAEVDSSPPPPEAAQTAETTRPQKPEATALARRIADQAGIDVNAIEGTGARGRVLRADVEKTLSPGSASTDAPVSKQEPTPLPSLSAREELIHLSTGCRFEPVLQVTEKLNEGRGGQSVSSQAALVRAIAMAVSQVEPTPPEAPQNESRTATRLRITGADESPAAVLEGAERMGLGAITARLKAAETVPPVAAGEVGLFHALESGVDRIEAHLEAGQICAFSVGAVAQQPMFEKNELVASATVEINLCADPRVFRTDTATRILGTVRQLLESPLGMVL